MDEQKTGEDDDRGADRESKVLAHTDGAQPVMPAVRHHPEEEERHRGNHQKKDLSEEEGRCVPGHADDSVRKAYRWD
jgi:hypothetical protein